MKARRVRDGQPLALDDVHAERRGIEQHVGQVVVQQVDLVDVEDPPVRLRQQAGLERLDALAQRAGDVDRARDAILGRVQGQVDDAHGSPGTRQLVAGGATLAAGGARLLRVAREGAVRDHFDLRQELCERPHGGRLPGSARALDEDASDPGVHGVDQERPLEALLVDDRGERVQAQVSTKRLPNVGSACWIGGNFQVPISGTAVSRFTRTSTT